MTFILFSISRSSIFFNRIFDVVDTLNSHPGPDILHPVEQRISLVTLGVRDLARARAFYEAMGWKGAQQPDDEVAFFQAGGMIFGLWSALGGHGAPGVELAHNVR